MATQADVRRIALSLPGTVEVPERFAFSVENKGKLRGFVWVWLERVVPKKPRVPQPKVLAVRVANLDDKEFLLRAEPAKLFTEPHYDGFPAVLVRLPAVTARELRPLITEAWRCMAPRERVADAPAETVAAPRPRARRRSPKRRRRGPCTGGAG